MTSTQDVETIGKPSGNFIVATTILTSILCGGGTIQLTEELLVSASAICLWWRGVPRFGSAELSAVAAGGTAADANTYADVYCLVKIRMTS